MDLRWFARLLVSTSLCAPSAGGLAGCGASGAGTAGEARWVAADSDSLPGVDTRQLTNRERQAWWTAVSELPAPCPDLELSLAECVREARPCRACRPAAEFVRDQILRGRTREQVNQSYRLRFDPAQVAALELTASPAKGAARPTVILVEWADFQCPFCGRGAELLAAQAVARPEHVQVVFKHYPLDYHEGAMQAALAAVAAHRQGKFWPFHDALYAHRTSLDERVIDELAREVGLDLERFAADRRSAEARAVVEQDMREADALGLPGTPFIFVNGRHFDFSSFDLVTELDEWVDLEIELRTGRPPGRRRAKGGAPLPSVPAGGVSPAVEPGP